MERAIFLDRDGTLIEDKGYVHKIEDFRLLPGTVEGLNLLKQDYLLFIITNQSGIARGFYTEQEFHIFNNFMLKKLKLHDIKIERTYFCQHLEADNCKCRKPNTKYIEEIAAEYEIDLKESWTIGDHPCDIVMGKNAGCKTAYLLTGHGKTHLQELKEKSIKPEIIARNFLYAARRIAEQK